MTGFIKTVSRKTYSLCIKGPIRTFASPSDKKLKQTDKEKSTKRKEIETREKRNNIPFSFSTIYSGEKKTLEPFEIFLTLFHRSRHTYNNK